MYKPHSQPTQEDQANESGLCISDQLRSSVEPLPSPSSISEGEQDGDPSDTAYLLLGAYPDSDEEENQETPKPTNTEYKPYRYGNYYSGYGRYCRHSGYGSQAGSSKLDSPSDSSSAPTRSLSTPDPDFDEEEEEEEEKAPVEPSISPSYYGGYGYGGYGSYGYGGYGYGNYYCYSDYANRRANRPQPAQTSINTRDTVYDNRQNVHAESIKDTIHKSVSNLMTDPQPDFDSTIDQVLSSDMSGRTKQKLIDFCDNTTRHSSTHLTIGQLVAYVWQRICNPGEADGVTADERRIELIRILEERIKDCFNERGNEVCFAGRFSRIVSTLDGFFPDIRIGISDNERITAIVLQVRDSLKPYDSVAHVSLATAALTEAGFEYEQYKAWIDEIESAGMTDSNNDMLDSDF